MSIYEIEHIVNILSYVASLLLRKENIDLSSAKIITLNAIISRLYEKLELIPPYKLNTHIDVKISQKIIDILYRNFDAYIDEIYWRFIPKDYRYSKGQLITPKPIARFMVRSALKLLSDENRIIRILDAGVGTGVFASELFDLASSLNKYNIEYYAIDIDKLLLNITYLRLYIKGLSSSNRFKLHLIHGDYLAHDIKDLDIIISNPPYINFRNYDTTIVNMLSRKIGINVTRLANIYALFMLKALNDLREGGFLIFITPSEYLFTQYGTYLKKKLLKYIIHAIIMFDYNLKVFEKAMTTPIITIVQKAKPLKNHTSLFITTSTLDLEHILSILLTNKVFMTREIKVYKIKQSSLKAEEKWIHLFYGVSTQTNQFSAENLQSLEKICIPLKNVVEVKRGIATGYNDFFLLSKSEVKKWGIENRYLRIAVSRAKHCKYFDLTNEDIEQLIRNGEKVFLLYIIEEYPISDNVKKYLKYGEKIGVNKRYLTSHRNPWYKVEEREPPPILLTTFSRGKFRFIYNKARALPVASAFHCVYPRITDECKIKALLAYLNSNIAMQLLHKYLRIHGLGLKKLEPKDLEMMPIPDLECLPREDLSTLASLFDKLCEASRHSPTDIDKIKKIIDSILLQISSKSACIRRGLLQYIKT